MDKLLPIGAVAKQFHLSVSTLRHYEDLGLVIPERVDSETGYRYYGPRQFEILNTIRYLRALDMPLPEIADFLRNRDVDRMEEKLRQQKAAVAEKRRELMRIEAKIDRRLRQLQEAQDASLGEIRQRPMPECRLVWMRQELRLHSFLDMEQSIRALDREQRETAIFLGKVGVSLSPEKLQAGRFEEYDGIFLVLEEEDRFHGKIIRIPAGECVQVRFRGSHPQAPAQYRKLMDYMAREGWTAAGFSREITMIDNVLTEDTEKFVTEITIPVTRKRPAE